MGYIPCFTAALAASMHNLPPWNVVKSPHRIVPIGPFPLSLCQPGFYYSSISCLDQLFQFPCYTPRKDVSHPCASALCSRSREHKQDFYLLQRQRGVVFTLHWDCRPQSMLQPHNLQAVFISCRHVWFLLWVSGILVVWAGTYFCAFPAFPPGFQMSTPVRDVFRAGGRGYHPCPCPNSVTFQSSQHLGALH